MIAVFTPLNGKPPAMLDLVIRYVNSLVTREHLEVVPVLTAGEDPVLIWDLPERGPAYHKLTRRIFIPYSPEAASLFFTGGPYSTHLAQNYRLREEEFPALFPVNRQTATLIRFDGEVITFEADVISQLFLLLSGWDERYSPKDSLGRVTHRGSLIERLKLTDRPLAEETVTALVQSFHALSIPDSFRFHHRHGWRIRLTHDIDHLRRRTPGFFLRKGFQALREPSRQDFGNVFSELLASFREPDPYPEALQWLTDQSAMVNAHPVVFLRSGKGTRRDSRINLNHPQIRRLARLSEEGKVSIGLHPTLKSAVDEEQFYRDWSVLKTAIPSASSIVRQHFLMFDPERTPAIHESAGMTADFTLGFHDHEGLRRATVHPFPGFRFDTWSVTTVWYVPLVFMDATASDYRSMSPEVALSRLESLVKTVRQWQGDVSVLFHNGFHPGFESGWAETYTRFLQICQTGHAWLGGDHG